MQQNKGYIIINGFLREEKFFSLYSALKQSADKAGLQLELKTNIELMCDIASGKPLQTRLCRRLQYSGIRTFALRKRLRRRG